MALIIAADIGGTNCRLGLFRLAKSRVTMDRVAWVETGSIAAIDNLLAAMEKELGTSVDKADAVCIAIAGPVDECVRGRLSNADLELDVSQLNTKNKRFFIINDFMAQAYAAVSGEGEKARVVYGPKNTEIYGVRAVIGAGTGLGQAILVPLDGRDRVKTTNWMAVASENGHAAFPFVNGAENDFHTFMRIRRKIPYATGDETVTGSGLAMLHEYLTGEKLSPPQVGAQYLSKDSRTLRWYSRLYARVCRNWMLSTMCVGGLWIAGGIAAQNPLVISCGHFQDELYNAPHGSAHWGDLLRGIPVHLMEDTNSGLWGAARFGQQEVERREGTMDQ